MVYFKIYILKENWNNSENNKKKLQIINLDYGDENWNAVLIFLIRMMV